MIGTIVFWSLVIAGLRLTGYNAFSWVVGFLLICYVVVEIGDRSRGLRTGGQDE